MSDKNFKETLGPLLSDIVKFLEDLKSSKLSKNDLIYKSQIIDRISKVKEEYPQLSYIVTDSDSSGSQVVEVYEDVEADGFTNKFAKIKSSQDLSASSSSSEESGVVIRGYLIRKAAGKSKIGFVSKLKDIIAKKYCLVENGTFFIYDNFATKKLNTHFQLYGYEVKIPKGQNKDFIFELICPGKRSYQFAAGNSDEFVKWTSALKSEVLKDYGKPLQSFIDDKNKDDDNDVEKYAEAVEYCNDAEIEKRATVSLEPEEELYDDIFTQDIMNTQSTSIGQMTQKPLHPRDEDIEELYDDVAEANKILTSTSNSTEKDSQAQKLSPNKNKALTVSSKDNLPYEKMFYGKWDCSAAAKDELPFSKGDIMTILSQEFDNFGWWVAELKGQVGLVPRDYLTPAYELITSK